MINFRFKAVIFSKFNLFRMMINKTFKKLFFLVGIFFFLVVLARLIVNVSVQAAILCGAGCGARNIQKEKPLINQWIFRELGRPWGYF